MTVNGLRVMVESDTSPSVVALEGELDLDTAPRFRAALSDLLDDETVAELTVDMSRLEFIDSTGLRVLVEAVSRLGERGGDLVIRRARPSTLKVLEICGLTKSVKLTAE